MRWMGLAAGLLSAATAGAQTPNDLSACLAELQAPARQAGVNAATWRTHTTGLVSEPRAVAALNTQPEFSTPIWDYLAVLVDEERVAQGQAMLATHADVLKRVNARYGVDPATVVAVWGVESNYGQGFGRFPIVQALATLSCEGRRQTFFRGELFAALRIVQAGHFPAEQFLGSWAGAFGHTQFMPTTFERLAVDFDGDGRADLMATPPTPWPPPPTSCSARVGKIGRFGGLRSGCPRARCPTAAKVDA